ncbi:S8 family serine peptidase [Acetivibrio straminisolvens]|nr:S8 family serine peptidase [Acetivibrio straminisolvens]
MRLAGKAITSIAIVIAIIIQCFSVTGMAYDKSIPVTKESHNSFRNESVNNEKADTLREDKQAVKTEEISRTVSSEVYGEGNETSDIEENSDANIEEKNRKKIEELVPPNVIEIGEKNEIDINLNKNLNKTKKDIIVVYKDISKANETKEKFKSKDNVRDVKTKYKSKRFEMEALEVSDQKDMEKLIAEIKSDPNVKYVQPDYKLNTFDIPQDEHFDKQWGLLNNGQIVNGQTGLAGIDINVLDAWDITTGDEEIVVAVVDTGVDINHPDLAANIFSNTNEILNGIDDDGNGLIDDVNGWDFANNDNSVNDSSTHDIHGTAVSGIIAAEMNDIGVTGAAPKVRILPVKFIEGSSGYTSDAIKAIEYAVDMGASIINCSWGGSEYNPALMDVISQSNALFVCAAGNSSSNTIQNPVYPASFDLDNIISVAAIGSDGNLAAFSNYGKNVDIAAPGTNILSTVTLERYDYLSGTSMAAPFVSATAALIKSNDTALTATEIKERILNNVTQSDKLSGKVKTSGRLNAYAALLNETPADEEPEPQEENEQINLREPRFVYDISAEGNNKVPKPIVREGGFFDDSGDNRENANVILSGGREKIEKITKKYPTVASATYNGQTPVSQLSLQDVSILSYVFDNNNNHTIDTAQAISECTVFGSMEESSQQDYYAINFEAGKRYTIRLTGMHTPDDFDLLLLNSSGGLLGFSYFGGSNEIITHTAGYTGVHYIVVEAYHVDDSTEHHNYQLLVYSDNNKPDVYEPNDSSETAQPITDGIPVYATLNINTDEDWFVIDITETGKLSITLKNIPAGCDYELEVYNSNLIKKYFSYASGNNDEKIDKIIDTSGRYYIRVYSYSGANSVENYELKVSVTEPDNYEVNDNIYDVRYYGSPLIDIGSTIYATIDNIDDCDIFKFNLNNHMNVGIRLQNIPEGNDYNLVVYSYSIYQGFFEVVRSMNVGSLAETIITQLNSGDYYVMVYSAGGFSETETYTLSIYDEDTVSKVYVELDKTTASEGDIITATVKVKQLAELAGIELNLAYDPNVVMPVKDDLSPYGYSPILSGSDIFLDEEYLPFRFVSHAPNEGNIRFSLCYVDIKAYRNSMPEPVDGTVAVIKFKVLRENQIQLKFYNAKEPDSSAIYLYDWYGNRIREGFIVEQPQVINEDLPIYVPEYLSISNIMNTPQGTTLFGSSPRKISGYIDINFNSKNPNIKEGFLVELKGASPENQSIIQTVTTDSNGYFEFVQLPSGYYNITITKSRFVKREFINVATIFEETVIGYQEEPIIMFFGDLVGGDNDFDNPDNSVNLGDIMVIVKSFNTVIGDADYNPLADLNDNGAINMEDVMILYINFGKSTSNYSVIKYKLYKNEKVPSFTLPIGELDLNGHTLIVEGNLTIDEPTTTTYATLNINGGSLYVTGNLILSGNARLIMRNSGDYILVNGNFETRSLFDHENNNEEIKGGDGKACLTDGVLEVKGNFTQNSNEKYWVGTTYVREAYGDPRNFTALENHKVIMSGDEVQHIKFDRVVIQANIDHSHFYTLEITKPLETGYTLELMEPSTVAWIRLIEAFSSSTPREGTTEDLEENAIARGGTVAATTGAKIYVFGGYNGDYLKVIEEYDPIKGKWTVIDESNQHRLELKIPRRDMGVVEVNNQIYVIGGENANGYVGEVEEFSSVTGSRVLTNIDPITGENKCEMPTPRTKVAVASFGNKIYAIGGFDGSYSNKVEVFDLDITRKAWTTQCTVGGQTQTIKNMPTARCGAAAVEFNGYIYVVGGYNDSGYLATVEKYDPVNNIWTTCSSMQYKRANLGLEVVEGKIYALGGYNGVDHLAVVEEYDPETNTWKKMTRSIVSPGSGYVEEPRSSFGTAVVYSQIYIVGGENKGGYMNKAQKYVPSVLPGLKMYTGSIVKKTVGDVMLSGDYSTQVSDLKIDSPGIPIELIRTYDSSDNEEKTVIGYGWRFNYDSKLVEISNYGKVTASALNVREKPTVNSKSFGLVPRGAVLLFETVNGQPVTERDVNGNEWYKIKLSDGKTAYVASWYVTKHSSGVEIKLGAGKTTVFEGNKTDGFTASYGNYDHLEYMTNTGEYVLVMSDTTRYGFKKISTSDNAYRLVWIEDKHKNRVNIQGEYVNSVYRITRVSDNAGRALTFNYSTSNTIIVSDNVGRTVQYLLNGTTGHLEQVINVYGKATKYTYYTAENDISTDKKNVKKLREIQTEQMNEETGVEEFTTIQRNYYDEDTGRIYKQTDAYDKVKYWRYIDPVAGENVDSEEISGTLERKFIDENNVSVSIQYSHFLKQPIREEYSDGSVVEYKYEMEINDAWVDTTNLTREENESIGATSKNRLNRKYTKDKYGYTTVQETDENGNVKMVTERFIDDGTDASVNSAPQTKYIYDYFYERSGNNITFRNNLTDEVEMKENNKTDAYTEYVYDETNKERLKEVKRRIEGSGDSAIYATTKYEYYNVGEKGLKVNGLIKEVIDPDGVKTEYDYHTNGYLKTVKDSLGNETQYTYDNVGRIKSKITPMGFNTEYSYGDDNVENVKEEVTVTVSDGERNSTTKTVYDGYGKKFKEISPIQYEKHGADADGTQYFYDWNGRLKTVVETLVDDEDNKVEYITKYTYDNAGNLQTEQMPDGTIYIYEYDELNRLKYKKFKKNEWVVSPVILEEYDYQAVDREPVKIGNKSYIVKNKVDIKNVYYKNGVYTPDECIQTKTTMDYHDRVEIVESTGQPTIRRKYSKNWKLSTETVGGYTTYYAYDGLGRIEAKRVPLEVRVEKDENGKDVDRVYYTKSKYSYKNSGKLLTEETGVEKVPLEGEKTEPDNYIVKKYEYDEHGRLEEVKLSGETQVIYDYDDDGNIYKEMINVSNYITGSKYQIVMYQNNHLGKPDRKYVFVEPEDIYGVTVPEGANYIYAVVTDYEYDGAGNVTKETIVFSATDSFNDYSIVQTYGESVVVSYTYDDLGRLETVTENGLIVPEGSTTSNTVYADITTVTKYNWDGTIKQVIDAKGNITEYEYSYEDTGRVEKVTSTINGLNTQGVRATSATYYDWAGRQIAEVIPENYDEGKSLEEMNRTEYIYENNHLKEKRYKGKLTELDTSTLNFVTTDGVDLLINRYDYDDYGNVTEEWSAIGYRDGYSTEYEYNLINKVTKIVDPEMGKLGGGYYSVKYDYDTFGRVISETKYKGYEAKGGEPVIYIENGQAESSYYAKTVNKYDNSGNLLKTWVKKGATDDITITESDTPILDNKYDVAGNLVSQTDANGNTTTYEYNGLNQVKRVTYPVDNSMKYSSSAPYQVNYQYDAVGNVRKEYDNLQKARIYQYDGRGLLQSQTEQREAVAADGTVTVSESITTSVKYDVNGNKRFEVDGNGNETEFIYDSLNRLEKTKIRVTNLDGISTHATIYTYDKNGNVLTETKSVQRGNISSDGTVTTRYDELGRIIEKKDAYGKSIERIVYDENSRQKYSYDARNNKTEYVYDNNDRVIETIDPEHHVTKQSYDYAGNLRTKTDGRNNVTTYIHDEFDRLWYVINAKGEKTRYTYDKNGNMLTQEILKTDGQNIDTVYISTTNEYNAANKITKRIDHGGRTKGANGSYSYDYRKVVSYRYDPDGTLREEIGRSKNDSQQNGAITTYTYDIHGRLKSQITTQADKTPVEISYVYDGNGNMTQMTDSTGLTSRIYDQLNRVKMKKAQDNGFVRYYYDIIVEDTTEQGETVYLTAEVSRDPESNQTTKVNDKAGRLKYVYDGTITNGASISSLNRSKLITYEYYDNGARKSVLYPEFTKSGQTFRYEEVYEYHPDGMLDTLINRKVKVVNQGAPTVETVIEKYEYTYDEANNQTKKIENLVGGTRITDYEYDALNRLETVSESNGRVTVYEYDVAGNRETEKISQNGTVQIFNTYVYDKQNRLERIETTGVETQIQSYRYDENGNQTEVYTVKGSTTEQTASYSYDLLNRMISATVGGKTVTYTYSGDGLRVSKYVDGTLTKYIYEYDKVVLELDGSGNQVGRNIYGTNLLMRQADGLSLYYLYNGHADVTALVDANTGVLRATYYYDAFGNIEEEKYYDANGNLTTTPINNNIRYAGYQYDEETGLYYLNARMYDPKIARFLQEDTYRGDPNDPLSLNLYVYVKNNPLIYYDLTGHLESKISYHLYKSSGYSEPLDEFILKDTGAGKLAEYRLMQANQMVFYAIRGDISQEARMQLTRDSYYLAEQARWEYAQTDVAYGLMVYGKDFRTEAKPVISINAQTEEYRFPYLVESLAFDLGWNPNPFVKGGLSDEEVIMPLARILRDVGFDVRDKDVAKTFFNVKQQVEAESARRNGWGDLLYYELNSIESIDADHRAHVIAYGTALSGYAAVLGNSYRSTLNRPEIYKTDSNGKMISRYEIIESDGIVKPNNNPYIKLKLKLNRDFRGKFRLKGTPKTTKLYRVMSEGEYESLMSNRQFTEYDRAMDSKWFATNTKDAVEWGKAFYPDGNYKIVEIEVPTDSLRQMYFVEKLDNIGPAYCAERDLINSIIQSIKEVLR